MTNVALVVLDTLRKDSFDEHFDWLPGVSFEYAYSTANWTAPAHASLFTGRYGSEVGVTAKSTSLACDDSVLAEVLAEAGYRTRGYSANHNASSQNRFDRGFREFLNPKELFNPDDDLLDWEEFLAEADSSGLELYLRAIAACFGGEHKTLPSLRIGLGKKFGRSQMMKTVGDTGASTVLQEVRETSFGDDEFLFVNLMEAHTPYDPPPEFNTLNEPVSVTLKNSFDGVTDARKVRRAYDDAARYLSLIYQRIYGELSRSFDYVITVSDHGELLGEYGFWNHTYGLYPELVRVPLVVTATGEHRREERREPVSLVDVHRTILELADVDHESRGQDLLGAVQPRDRLAEYRGLIPFAVKGLREIGFNEDEVEQYDRAFSALVGGDGLYAIDMEDGWYPEEVEVAEARERLDRLHAEVKESAVEPDRQEANDVPIDRLEQLGYV